MDYYYILQKSGKIDKNYYRLYKKIESGYIEKSYKDAKKLSKIPFFLKYQPLYENQFIQYVSNLGSAREKVLDSIEKKPNNEKYSKLLIDINNNIDDVNLTYSSNNKKNSLSNGLKRANWNIAIGLDVLSNIGDEESPLSLDGTHLGMTINAAYNLNIFDDYYNLIILNAGFNMGRTTVTDSEYNYNNNFFLIKASLCIDFGFSWRSLGLYIGPVIQVGGMYKNSEYIDLTAEPLPSIFSMTISFGADMRAVYYFKNNFFIYYSIKLLPTFLTSQPDKLMVNNTIGVGYEF